MKIKSLIGIAALLLVLEPVSLSADEAEQANAATKGVSFDAESLVVLTEHFAEYRDRLPAAECFGTEKLAAYEQHPLFGYLCGEKAIPGLGSLRRRVILLRPSLLLVDDTLQLDKPSAEAIPWILVAADQRHVMRPGPFRVKAAEKTISCEPLWNGPSTEKQDQPLDTMRIWRFQNLFHLLPDTAENPKVEAAREDQSAWEIRDGRRRYRVALPVEDGQATIAISSLDGEILLPARPLPAGILPHGEQGVRLLQRWDSAYQDNRRPGWDIGRTASDLKQAVEQDVIQPGRAVVLGCGTGTNAIYLAQQKFDVTGIDLAPRALARAKQKAAEADVAVRWLLADVTAPPDVEPFDFVFDRGCYHGVRRGNAAGYVAALRRLTRPGAHVLILAGNANEERQYGPPRVTEHQIRGDFAEDFDFVWLKETRFDSSNADRAGAMAWSILLRRKGKAARTMQIRVLGPDGKPLPDAEIHRSVWPKESFEQNRDLPCNEDGVTHIDLPHSILEGRLPTGPGCAACGR